MKSAAVMPRKDALFHPKVYLYSNGETMSAVVGSHNMTKSAMGGGNVEASVLLQGPKDHPALVQLKDFVTKIWFRTRCYTSLSREEYKQATRDLEGLVLLRNELVHHFLERFNVWTIEGGDAADVYLDESYATIDRHYQTLRYWADGMDSARNSLSQFMLSPEGQIAFLHSLQPQPAAIDWPHNKIASLLHAAEETLNEHGWTLLAKAIDAMRWIDPEETPKRYGFSSWRKVIHESRLFEIRKTRAPGPRGSSGLVPYH